VGTRRFLLFLGRGAFEFTVATHYGDTSIVLPWVESPGRIHCRERDVCATRANPDAHGLYKRILVMESSSPKTFRSHKTTKMTATAFKIALMDRAIGT
jgi:hypothetical protein